MKILENLPNKIPEPDFGPEFFQNKLKEGYIGVSYGTGIRVKNIKISEFLVFYHKQGTILTQEYIQQFPSEDSEIPSCYYKLDCDYLNQQKLSEHLDFFKIQKGQIIDLRNVDWKTYKK